MAVSRADTDIDESHCHGLLSMYRRTSDESRNRRGGFPGGPNLHHGMDDSEGKRTVVPRSTLLYPLLDLPVFLPFVTY